MEISIVMPVYNGEKFLNEAIDSILQQTFTDYELLIIDDGSEDHSVDIIEAYNDQRICLLRNEHDFIKSLNTGLEHAKGKYIARMDADDVMCPERLEVQYKILEKYPEVSVCASWFQYFGDVEEVCQISRWKVVEPLIQMLKGNLIAHPTTMIRKCFLQEHQLKYEYYNYAEDFKLWSEVAKAGGVFYVVPRVLLKYRTSPTQVSIMNADAQQLTDWEIRNEILSFLLENNYQEDEEVQKLFQSIFYFNDAELLSPQICFELFYEIFRNKQLKCFEGKDHPI